MKKIFCVIGTRPECIKMAPVIKALKKYPGKFSVVICSTGQHREMLAQTLEIFELVPDITLDTMVRDQTLSGLTSRLFTELDKSIREQRPDWVLAQGDTTTVMVAAIVSFYNRVKFGHIEAGLRTGDLNKPFPEELNRCIADIVADAYFAPTSMAAGNIEKEGRRNIYVTGNTVIDALKHISGIRCGDFPVKLTDDSKMILVTAHRRESFGKAFDDLCGAIRFLAEKYAGQGYCFVYPVHLNPNVREPVKKILSGCHNVFLCDPVNYVTMVHMIKRSYLILTDSGGLQEEAPYFKVPVIVMRDATERPEGVLAGVSRLAGTDREKIIAATSELLDNPVEYEKMRNGINPYGDGNASERICEVLDRS